MKNFQDRDMEPTEHERKQIEEAHLKHIRYELGEVYWQLFLPEWDKMSKINPRIEKLMNYLVYAISLQLNDFDGWEETEDLIAEYEYMFREEKMEVITDQPVDEDTQNIRFHFNDGEEEEIPF